MATLVAVNEALKLIVCCARVLFRFMIGFTRVRGKSSESWEQTAKGRLEEGRRESECFSSRFRELVPHLEHNLHHSI